MLQNTANRKELFPDGEPGHGISSERKTVLEQNFCKWLYKAQEAFDDKVLSCFNCARYVVVWLAGCKSKCIHIFAIPLHNFLHDVIASLMKLYSPIGLSSLFILFPPRYTMCWLVN